MPLKPITVAIVEDDEEILGGLESLISRSRGFRCLATCSSAESALDELPGLKPNVVLMDINLPRMSGIECVRRMKAQLPEVQVIMQTVYEDYETIFQSLAAGAVGYLLKKTPPEKLLEAIRDVHNGGSPMSSQIARKVVHTFLQTGTSPKETENLTKREHEILTYLSKGYRYKEIADVLYISVETVRTHLRNIYEKLHVRSRTEALLKFLQK